MIETKHEKHRGLDLSPALPEPDVSALNVALARCRGGDKAG